MTLITADDATHEGMIKDGLDPKKANPKDCEAALKVIQEALTMEPYSELGTCVMKVSPSSPTPYYYAATLSLAFPDATTSVNARDSVHNFFGRLQSNLFIGNSYISQKESTYTLSFERLSDLTQGINQVAKALRPEVLQEITALQASQFIN